MSDEPIKLVEGMMPALPRDRNRVLGHVCAHEGCTKHAGFGFARPRQEPAWFCFEHKADGEHFL
ncbi:MAG: hypothetical protein E5Y07_00565 [Mesorhizobium sp.]|nr:MAG: hypothetical protein E5Y07_00565 [Mesorhizobium sp.]